MKTRLITASLFVMLHLENFSRFAPQPGNEPRGYNSTSQHGGARRGSAGGGACESPAPSPGREGFRFRQWREQPRSGPCGWRPSRVCLLLRRRHIVCVRSGERGRGRCRFHHRYRGSRQARPWRGGGGPRIGQPGRGRPWCSQRTPECPSPAPAPPTHTHTPAAAPATHRGGPGPPPTRGGGRWGVEMWGAEADVKLGASFGSPPYSGEEDFPEAGTRG